MFRFTLIKLAWQVLINIFILHCFAQENSNQDFQWLVNWIRTGGGRVDERLGIGIHVHNGVQVRGGVALKDIEEGSELLFCPWELVLGTIGGTSTVTNDQCANLENYENEVRAGEESFWFPYLNMDESLSTRIPTLWSSAVIAEAQGMPPFDRTDPEFPSLTDWFSQTCKGGKPFKDLDGPARQSLLAVITRSAGMRFLPLLDLLNHHNGFLNTRSHADKNGNTLTAARKISAGEEIIFTYLSGKSTSTELFRKYGFIESWPQQYAWPDLETGKEAVRFLVLAHGVVMLYPPDSITNQIGTVEVMPTLNDLHHGGARLHNEGLPLERLRYFLTTVNRILTSLPTSVEDDETILADLMGEQRSQYAEHGIQEENIDLSDRIIAVEYRMHLKNTLKIALKATESAILNHQQTKQTEHEL